MNTSVSIQEMSHKSADFKPCDAITPMKLGLNWDIDLPEFWFNDNPFLTHFMNAFSGVLPQGERFMIDSVRAGRDKVKDNKALSQDISGFIGQEAYHALEHKAFNHLIASYGVPFDKLENLMTRITGLLNKLPERDRIAVTGAVEHFTALFGKVVLVNPDLLKQIHPNLQAILIWHAIEELEHKAVAFDVFQITDGDYLRRIEGLFIATLAVGAAIAYGQAVFLWSDRSLFKLGSTAKGLWWMFGIGKRAGYMRKVLPEYFDFFRPNFHPSQDDTRSLIAEWKPILQSQLQKLTTPARDAIGSA